MSPSPIVDRIANQHLHHDRSAVDPYANNSTPQLDSCQGSDETHLKCSSGGVRASCGICSRNAGHVWGAAEADGMGSGPSMATRREITQKYARECRSASTATGGDVLRAKPGEARTHLSRAS